MKLNSELVKKYDVPVPRYTSYPTVPFWTDSPTREQWVESLKSAAKNGRPWSMYLHIPFCETLCTFCGCNTVITKDHKREVPYVDKLLAELNIYKTEVPELFQLPLVQIHLGGGTPTFLQADELRRLILGIKKHTRIDPKNFEGSIEVDPRRTTSGQLKELLGLGFSRVSMGVQDFDAEVQRLVNRVQPLEITRKLTEDARAMGYSSVNYDLIYGLPKQSLASFTKTAEETVRLRPDRIALYSFALVPWIKPQQRLFKDEDLPAGEEKRALYERAYEILTASGYVEIGMDHFALKEEALAKASAARSLHRNFMGYTEWRTEIMLGLGVSAISESPTCFHQNEKALPVYERVVDEGKLPTFRGHKLNAEDQIFRELILRFMTQLEVELPSDEMVKDAIEFLSPMVSDGLVKIEGRKLLITEIGKPFLRNAAVVLDRRMRVAKPQQKIFSQAV